MSIFKQTFSAHIQRQIEIRQDLLSSKKRDPQFSQYVSGASPWVKMTSMVDYDNNVKLAKDYILFGGTLKPKPDDKTNKIFGLRSGVSNSRASYGSDLGSNEYGIRPMPGITSLSVKSRGAYGSLRDVTIKYYAWDLKQLQNLEILYMKPGYPVIVEWGWSTYLNNNSKSIANTNVKTIDCFESNLKIEDIYAKLKKLNQDSFGNYEGCLGLIKNFEYSSLPNGGFECTTVLVSMGEVIASLKMNVENSNAPVSLSTTSIEGTNAISSVDIKDEFELTMDAYCNNQLGLNGTVSQIAVNYSNISNVDTNIITFGDPNSYGADASNDLRYTKFIQFGYFVGILNEKYNLFLSNNQSLIKYELPLPDIADNKGNGLCVASYNSVTIDNSVCIIQNSEAKIFNKDYGFSPHVDGSALKVTLATINPLIAQSNLISPAPTATTKLKEYLYPNTNLGIIGNIYLNIGNIISIYKKIHVSNQGKVSAIVLLKKILEEVQYALGSVNSFDVFSYDNRVVIIDKHYVENPSESSYDSKFKINILGNNTTVREQKVVSRIFEEQSMMIAIAAQDRENIGSMQTSTNVFINKRIYNRLYKNSGFSKEDAESTKENEEKRAADKKILLNNIINLKEYINNNIVLGKWPKDKNSIQSSLNTFLNTLIVKLEGGTDYKGILPLSLEFKMDGIGGITIGEIFTVNKEVLPAQYSDNAIGFIVVSIDEEITRSDWTTSIKAQFCLLNQQQRQKESLARRSILFEDVEKEQQSLILELKKSIIYRNILIGFIHDFFNDSIGIKDSKELYYVGSTQPRLFKVLAGKDLPGNFFPDPTKYESRPTAKLPKGDVYLHLYLNTANFTTILTYFTQEDYEENVVKFLTSAVKNSYFYNNMTNTEVKNIFDGELNGIINAYKSQASFLRKSAAAASIGAEILVETLSGGFLDFQDAISNNFKIVESGTVKLHQLNPEAYTDYGTLDKQKLLLTQIIEIKFNDNFRAKKSFKIEGDN